MTNHIHLLIERRADNLGRKMHRVLTGYSQPYTVNTDGRAIYCRLGARQFFTSRPRIWRNWSGTFTNPVRTGLVGHLEGYHYRSHRAYMGIEPVGIADVAGTAPLWSSQSRGTPVLRGICRGSVKLGSMDALYKKQDGVLGSGSCRLGDPPRRRVCWPNPEAAGWQEARIQR